MTYHSDNFCTVLTDASWCPDQKVGGWAVWIVCNGERFKRFDAFFEKLESAKEAEIKAIINGLYIAKRVFSPDAYHVVSDCIYAMRELQGQGSTQIWRKKMLETIGDSRVSFKHVKAHTNKDDKRSYVNNWCDFQAKLAMRSLRTEQKEKTDDTKR